MNTEEQLVEYVRTALQAKEAGKPVDIRQLCRKHPELVEPVEEALLLQDSFVEATQGSDDPLRDEVLDDRYALELCIGMGAMGAVYEATDRSLKRAVAVKILQRGFFDSDERRKRFVREAQVLASLKHDHIVEIHDHGRTDTGLHYIVMERLQGVALSNLIESAAEAPRPRGLPGADWRRAGENETADYIPQVVSWIADLAGGLRQAHDAGVFHRDVKPSNIFITNTDRAVLLDFGIATRAEDGSLTTKGTTLGTPWYMAPEQAVSGQSANAKVDIYGLCATLYHLVTFRPPYEGDSADVLVRLRTEDPPPPTKLMPGLPRDLGAIIEKGMERKPEHRYADMAALEEDLRAFLAHLPVHARPISGVSRLVRRIRRRPGPALAGVAIVLAIGVTIPIAESFFSAAQARTVAQDARYLQLLAAVPPSVAFEGSFEIRVKMDPAERNGYIEHLGRILELRPDDHFTRLLRSALLQDRGDFEASATDVLRVQGGADSEYTRALVQRYREVGETQRGVQAVRFAGLPEPQTELDKLVAAFHFARQKKYADAERLLAGSNTIHARYLRLGTLLPIGQRRFYANGDRALLDEALAEATRIEQALGADTARTNYFRGTAFLVLDDLESAVAALRRSRELCPDAYGTNYNLGCGLHWMDHYEDALDQLLHAQTLRPWNLNAGYEIARVKAAQGDFAGAVAIVDKMPKTGYLIEPWHHDQLLGFIETLRAAALYGEGKDAEAVAASENAMSRFEKCADKISPTSPDRRALEKNLLALFRDEMSPTEQTQRVLALLENNPFDPVFLSVLAVVFGRLELDANLRRSMVEFIKSLSIRSAKRGIDK